MGPRVHELLVYPFKSGGGISVDGVEVDEVGLHLDRGWMAVTEQGEFVSQRTHPRMALLRTELLDDAVVVHAPGVGSIRMPMSRPEPDAVESIRVWFSDRYAMDCGSEPAEWISEYVGERCRVVRAARPSGLPLLTEEGRVRGGFADASPALVISTASLEELNRRLARPLPMDRFRPNIVVAGLQPFEEDAWDRRRVGAVPTRGGRPCPRCATTLVDQATGARGVEPLRTLATFRRRDDGQVDFGMNVFFEQSGRLEVGDRIGPSP